MFNTGEAVRVLSFCFDLISINSVFFFFSLFVQAGLNDIHIFISIGKMRIIGIHSRIRVS